MGDIVGRNPSPFTAFVRTERRSMPAMMLPQQIDFVVSDVWKAAMGQYISRG